MLRFLCDKIKETVYKLYCKQCNSVHYTAIGIVRHLHREHNIKLTKRDFRFLLRYNLITRLFMCLVSSILFVLLFLIKIILIPFYYLYEAI